MREPTMLFHSPLASSSCPFMVKWKQSWVKNVMSILPLFPWEKRKRCVMWILFLVNVYEKKTLIPLKHTLIEVIYFLSRFTVKRCICHVFKTINKEYIGTWKQVCCTCLSAGVCVCVCACVRVCTADMF